MGAHDELAEVTGLDRSALEFLRDASEDELAALSSAVRAARSARAAELQTAIDQTLRTVPRPLRGRIRRLLGG